MSESSSWNPLSGAQIDFGASRLQAKVLIFEWQLGCELRESHLGPPLSLRPRAHSSTGQKSRLDAIFGGLRGRGAQHAQGRAIGPTARLYHIEAAARFQEP